MTESTADIARRNGWGVGTRLWLADDHRFIIKVTNITDDDALGVRSDQDGNNLSYEEPLALWHYSWELAR